MQPQPFDVDDVFASLRGVLEGRCEGYGVALPRLRLNPRLRSSAGRFLWSKRGKVRQLFGTATEPVIELSTRYLNAFGFEPALGVLHHEFAHYLQWKKRGKTSHNIEFKTLCAEVGGTMSGRMAGKRWAACATDTFLVAPYKYLYHCPGCGLEFKRRRRIAAKMVCRGCKTPTKQFKVTSLG